MARPRGADHGWLVIAGFVVGHNVLQAGRGREMLSEGCDRYLERRPWLTRGVIALVALHLANAIPTRCDPLNGLALLLERARGRPRNVGATM